MNQLESELSADEVRKYIAFNVPEFVAQKWGPLFCCVIASSITSSMMYASVWVPFILLLTGPMLCFTLPGLNHVYHIVAQYTSTL